MVTAGEAAADVVVGAVAGVDVAVVIVVIVADYERHSKINDLHG
jgi:hypothetical protein